MLPLTQTVTGNLVAPMQFIVVEGNQACGVFKAW